MAKDGIRGGMIGSLCLQVKALRGFASVFCALPPQGGTAAAPDDASQAFHAPKRQKGPFSHRLALGKAAGFFA
jgi:hypothetical protein